MGGAVFALGRGERMAGHMGDKFARRRVRRQLVSFNHGRCAGSRHRPRRTAFGRLPSAAVGSCFSRLHRHDRPLAELPQQISLRMGLLRSHRDAARPGAAFEHHLRRCAGTREPHAKHADRCVRHHMVIALDDKEQPFRADFQHGVRMAWADRKNGDDLARAPYCGSHRATERIQQRQRHEWAWHRGELRHLRRCARAHRQHVERDTARAVAERPCARLCDLCVGRFSPSAAARAARR